MAHTGSMRATKLVFCKSAKGRRDAWDRRRASLATDMKILGPQCPRDLERLFDYSIQLWEKRKIETEGLAASAENVIVCEQRELRKRESPLEWDTAFELAEAKEWAIHALVYLAGGATKPVKEIELRLLDNAPLAICLGQEWRKVPRREGERSKRDHEAPPFMGKIVTAVVIDKGEAQEFSIPAYGCCAIFLDATQTTRHAWKHWCPDCAPSKSHGLEKAREAHQDFIYEWLGSRRAELS
jgi:hypothetical protein